MHRLLIALLLLPAPLSPLPAAEKAATNPDKKICKVQPPRLGSRLGPRRMCGTAAEWALMRNEMRKMLDKIQGKKFMN